MTITEVKKAVTIAVGGIHRPGIYLPPGARDITPYVQTETIQIVNSAKVKTDSLSFEMIAPAGKRPHPGQPIAVYWNHFWLENGELKSEIETLFAGSIVSVTQRWLSPKEGFHFEVEAQDWTRIFDKHLITYKQEIPVPAHEIIVGKWDLTRNEWEVEPLISRLPGDAGFEPDKPGYGFKAYIKGQAPAGEKGYVEKAVDPVTGEDIKISVNFDLQTLSSCMDEIADRVGYSWKIDFDRNVHFYRSWPVTEPLTGQFQLLRAEDLINWGDLLIREDVSEIKNVVTVKDAKQKAETEVIEELRQPGPTFRIPDKPFIPYRWPGLTYDQRNAFVRVWAYDATDALQGEYNLDLFTGITTGDEWQAFLSPAKQMLILSDRAQEAFKAGNWYLKIRYFPVVDAGPQVFPDPEGIELIAKREGWWDGRYEYVTSEPQLEFEEAGEEAKYFADVLLARWSRPKYTGSFRSFKRGWKAGTRFYWYLSEWLNPVPRYPDSLRAWAEYLPIFPWGKVPFYIQTVTQRVHPKGLIESLIEFSSTPYD